ncbi:MAG: helix-turn-helix transcriptional regulator [Gammaproteobacteria bacterium]
MESRHPNLVKIGKKIREARKAKGFSQEDFAAEANLARSYLGRLERGEQNISIQNLIQIALTLKVELYELLPPLKQLKTPHTKKFSN